jgi:hypothetical protein
MDIENKIETVIAAPETSYWLKRALTEAQRRDCVDALRDAELLASLLRERFEATTGGHGHAAP